MSPGCFLLLLPVRALGRRCAGRVDWRGKDLGEVDPAADSAACVSASSAESDSNAAKRSSAGGAERFLLELVEALGEAVEEAIFCSLVRREWQVELEVVNEVT